MTVYPFLLKNVLLPMYSRLRNRQYLEHLRLLEASQWWPAGELRDFQWTELRKLLQVAFRSVPYYQKKYKGIDLEEIRSWDDFSRLPILTRADVNEHRAELCSRSFRGTLLPHATGGSSGSPTQFYITYESYDWRLAAKDRAYSWSGLDLGKRSGYLWGAPVGKVSRIHLAKERLHAAVDRRLVVNTFVQSSEFWFTVYQRLRRFSPRVLVGYVSSLEQFASYLDSAGLFLPSLKSIITAAEPLFDPARKRIETVFRTPVFATYGSREFMSLAAECECHYGYHINAENVIIETTENGASEPSQVIVTDLHNYGMPFVRYAIGDLGTIDQSQCRCGRGLPRLKNIEGRVLDSLRTADGKVVPGEFFPHLLKELPEIVHYQVQQQRQDYLVISAVLGEPLQSTSRRLLQHEIARVFGPGMKWEVKPVSSIPALPSGKRRVTVGLT